MLVAEVTSCNTLFAPRMYEKRPGTVAPRPVVKREYPELACYNLNQAIDEAKRSVLEADKNVLLQADACTRNLNQVRTKYRCWIDERGAFNELALA